MNKKISGLKTVVLFTLAILAFYLVDKRVRQDVLADKSLPIAVNDTSSLRDQHTENALPPPAAEPIKNAQEALQDLNKTNASMDEESQESGLDDFFASLPNDDGVHAYAWIMYETTRYQEVPKKMLVKGGYHGDQYYEPLYQEAHSIVKHDTHIYYTAVKNYSSWSHDTRYKLLDEAEAALMNVQSYNSPPIKILSREAFVFYTYAGASKSLSNRKAAMANRK